MSDKILINVLTLEKIERIIKNVKNNIVFLCLGNREVNFDCYASFVAKYLRKNKVKAYVYGGNKFPLYGKSLSDMSYMLNKVHKNDTIVFIDVVKTNEVCSDGNIVVSSKKYQVSNSDIVFNYDYSICYLVNISNKVDHYNKQKFAAKKIATFISNYC